MSNEWKNCGAREIGYDAPVRTARDIQFHGLVAIVQYRRKDGFDGWKNMAAFDNRDVAFNYAEDCSKGDRPWEYRAIDVEPDSD